jgi:catechol 2,3-dioxygenase-like lactoylglutathione lyase family enzyme
MSQLGAIRGVTLSAYDLDATEAAYNDYLGYQTVARTEVSEAAAKSWQCPAAAGAQEVLLQPASGVDFWVRLVETPEVSGYRPLTTYGWNAAEYMVQDVDQLANSLANSPFEMIGEPADLSFSDAIRACQVKGPANEILYLTQFKRPLPEFDVPPALSSVDRVFIGILGGPDLEALKHFYAEQFGVPDSPNLDVVVSVMSDALGLPSDTLHAICALPLGGKCFIEADQCPPTATERPRVPGHLPPGTAMLSFEVPATSLPRTALRHSERSPLMGGAASAVLTGAGGELLELIGLEPS